jgi:predicted transcriptional regulator
MANMENPISIRVPKELLAELDIISEAERRSRSFLILEAVREKYGARTAAGIERVDKEIAAKKIADVSAVAERGEGAPPACAPRGKVEEGGIIGGGEKIAEEKPVPDILLPIARTPELMASLRKIAAGKVHPDDTLAKMGASGHGSGLVEPQEVDLCWRKEYNPETGQTGACGRPKGHKGKCGAWEVVD